MILWFCFYNKLLLLLFEKQIRVLQPHFRLRTENDLEYSVFWTIGRVEVQSTQEISFRRRPASQNALKLLAKS